MAAFFLLRTCDTLFPRCMTAGGFPLLWRSTPANAHPGLPVTLTVSRRSGRYKGRVYALRLHDCLRE